MYHETGKILVFLIEKELKVIAINIELGKNVHIKNQEIKSRSVEICSLHHMRNSMIFAEANSIRAEILFRVF